MQQNTEALEKFFLSLRDDVRQNIPSVTGKTAAAIRINIGEKIGQLIGPAYLPALEVGRGPTRNRTKGAPTLRENILIWIRAKGLATGKEAESLSYAISKKIHAEGTRLYRSGINSGAISDVITEQRIQSFSDDLIDANVEFFRSTLLSRFNKAFSG